MAELVNCPYNSSHRMLSTRLCWHLTKGCPDQRAKRHLYSVCPFNGTHHVPTPTLASHSSQCLDNPNRPANQSDSVFEASEEDWVVVKRTVKRDYYGCV